MNDTVTFSFPAKTEYIPAIRLAVSGIASHLDMDVLQIENMKSCITESCMLLICSQSCNTFNITINITDDSVDFSVRGQDAEKIAGCRGCMEFNAELAKMMIRTMSTYSELVRNDFGALTQVIFRISSI